MPDPLNAPPARLLADAALLRTRGRLDEAEALLAGLLGLQPTNLQAWRELGALRVQRRDWPGAEEAFLRLTALRPTDADAWNNLGAARQRRQRHREAETAFKEALALEGDRADILSNLGLALVRSGRAEEAEPILRRALALEPRAASAWHNLALAHRAAGRMAEFDEALDHAQALQPRNPEIRTLRAQAWLESGRWREGWAGWEARWDGLPELGPPPRPDLRRWGGEAREGRRLLVLAEQGYGDLIQFLRFVPGLAAHGPVTVESPPALEPLLRAQGWPVEIVLPGHDAPADLALPLLSLPRVLGLHDEADFGPMPYLRAEPHRVQAWRERLAGLPGLRAGLVWTGNPAHTGNAERSLTLEACGALLDLKGVSWVSLQRGPGEGVLEASPHGKALFLAAPFIRDFADTAAALEALDVLVSVDSAAAHLAGALGRPTHLLLARPAEWRWMRDRTDSPWYAGHRLHRQAEAGEWRAPVAGVCSALSARAAGAG